ncbi:hypothetical protein ASO20_00645 [Mycoplasma sp. (ex Biomphalaria glabrata)]|uniref:hypothetical protein n=1 Tax=Mycoplasma sp. (ex Biomphalaria glabrata) TaxID=1749074 RepID=UPI00073AC9EA|nr:hypothetical protein [Mycoplasma sp. (ex Biomphalaria glabrata)]ALV23184.1 hypothetical protein ASO20_00645 [Mycoplasma sp. (ex Biomphalaria glabrata)]
MNITHFFEAQSNQTFTDLSNWGWFLQGIFSILVVIFFKLYSVILSKTEVEKWKAGHDIVAIRFAKKNVWWLTLFFAALAIVSFIHGTVVISSNVKPLPTTATAATLIALIAAIANVPGYFITARNFYNEYKIAKSSIYLIESILSIFVGLLISVLSLFWLLDVLGVYEGTINAVELKKGLLLTLAALALVSFALHAYTIFENFVKFRKSTNLLPSEKYAFYIAIVLNIFSTLLLASFVLITLFLGLNI